LSDDRAPSPLERAQAELHALGVELASTPGAYRFRYTCSGRAAPFLSDTADDLIEAIRIGRELAAHGPPAPLVPLGPTGRRGTRRGEMYKHNRKIAAKRRRGGRLTRSSSSGQDRGE